MAVTGFFTWQKLLVNYSKNTNSSHMTDHVIRVTQVLVFGQLWSDSLSCTLGCAVCFFDCECCVFDVWCLQLWLSAVVFLFINVGDELNELIDSVVGGSGFIRVMYINAEVKWILIEFLLQIHLYVSSIITVWFKTLW